MSGSIYGKIFTISTWGESHGAGVGVCIDGCPAGLELSETDVQTLLDRRRPGQSAFTTQRKESDTVKILSGVFEGKTTGTPISMMVVNEDQHSKDYSALEKVFRPGHADFTFTSKYGIRDHRGGGRSSGRETIGRVAAGAICAKLLRELGVEVFAYTKSIGDIRVSEFELGERDLNPLAMPDSLAAKEAQEYLEACMLNKDSAGGVIECVITGVPAGIGEPVFDKLDAKIAQALVSIGAVKGVEIGDGFEASKSVGSINNDAFEMVDGRIVKTTNHSGGILGGISDGDDIIVRAAIKPTPSISQVQHTVNENGENVDIEIHGRHDPVVVPRAVVVVEAMCAITICDAMLSHMTDRVDYIKEFYKN